jgi:hypothetical protein
MQDPKTNFIIFETSDMETYTLEENKYQKL